MTSLVLGLFLLAQTAAEPALSEEQRSNIEANVPASREFAGLLQRDLDHYFNPENRPGTRVDFELLYDKAIPSNASYPTFYVWLRVVQAGSVVKEGAARVAAVERKSFEVTTFVGERDLRMAPVSALSDVFPEPVLGKVKARLGIRP